MKPHHILTATLFLAALPVQADSPAVAAQAVNALGLDLLAKGTEANSNTLLSPYSIQSALAMTFAGAAGDTRAEMARVLHYPADEASLHQSFAALRKATDSVKKDGNPILLTVANRLFGQQGDEFRQPFLDLVKDTYGAPFQPMDFVRNAPEETRKINGWVEEQTQQRIRDLILPGTLNFYTRLVLVNAIYMKAPWVESFDARATQPQPFQVKGSEGEARNVPTMFRKDRMGYAKRDGYQIITVPYTGGDMQLLVLLPEAKDGLAALEAKLTPEILGGCANLHSSELRLYLPKFTLEPPLLKLGKTLRTLGMTSAFDQPKGSANFDRMASRHPDHYLYITEVFHKTFLALDEKGTEAAAATAVQMSPADAPALPTESIEVRVDHPFLFAIQHRPSGACLFLGRVTDPRTSHFGNGGPLMILK